ncbi:MULTISPECIES: two-component system activity regulator YycH [Clostridia]|uniref:YycH family regulatory protein n=1 Tax=Clostridia TaxID=186801 RepID=UPI000EA07D85|nr:MULTISPECIES: two-component system activity regulator YycH [Clostridia]NBJ69818.1 hypothetical protein [Roseburia sp. 1XD42-34]RKI77890.1 hypothetical protein D7V87_10100 [Clostridium sp. 1xD42-85]
MKLETFKSIILVLLIGLSLLLTFGLWNYQSEFEELEDLENVSETSVGGKQMETKSNVIEPSSIIFHAGEQHLGYKNPQKNKQFFLDMQTWIFTDFSVRESNQRRPPKGYDAEIIFPDALPIQIAANLFHFPDTEEIEATWSFDRIYLYLDKDTATISVQFPSIDGRRQAKASLNDSVNYNKLEKLFASREGLTEYILVNEDEKEKDSRRIFIPSNTDGLQKRSLIVNKIPPDLFVRALFPNLTRVSRSDKGDRGIGEFYFADSEREMRIQHHETKLEFYNPNAVGNPSGSVNPVELIDRSISRVDSHDGWFGDYSLYDLDAPSNRVIYQMRYNGYPVHSRNGLSFIEIQYEGQDIYQYNRSLLKLSNEVNTEEVDVPSGEKVIQYVTNELSDTWKMEQIENIQLGYDFQYQTDNSVILEPTWFIQINGEWKRLFPEEDTSASQQRGD